MSMITYMLKYPVESFSVIVKLFPIIAIYYMMGYKSKVNKYLFWYLVFQLCIGILMIWLGSRRQNNLLFYNLSVYVGFGMLARMFYVAFHFDVDKKLVVGLTTIFYTVTTFDFMNVGDQSSLKIGGTLECLFLIIFIFRYGWEICQELKIINLFRYPLFYFCAGLLLYACSKTFLAPMLFYIDAWDGPTGFEINRMVPTVVECFYLIIVGIGFLVEE